MDAGLAALLGALIGALAGVAGTVGSAVYAARAQQRRDLLAAAIELGKLEFQEHMADARRKGGAVAPLSFYVVIQHQWLLNMAKSMELSQDHVAGTYKRSRDLFVALMKEAERDGQASQ